MTKPKAKDDTPPPQVGPPPQVPHVESDEILHGGADPENLVRQTHSQLVFTDKPADMVEIAYLGKRGLLWSHEIPASLLLAGMNGYLDRRKRARE